MPLFVRHAFRSLVALAPCALDDAQRVRAPARAISRAAPPSDASLSVPRALRSLDALAAALRRQTELLDEHIGSSGVQMSAVQAEAAELRARVAAMKEDVRHARAQAAAAEERARQEAGLRARQASLDREQLEEARTQADLAAAKKKAQQPSRRRGDQ